MTTINELRKKLAAIPPCSRDDLYEIFCMLFDAILETQDRLLSLEGKVDLVNKQIEGISESLADEDDVL